MCYLVLYIYILLKTAYIANKVLKRSVHRCFGVSNRVSKCKQCKQPFLGQNWRNLLNISALYVSKGMLARWVFRAVFGCFWAVLGCFYPFLGCFW
jgi:hypothetical protein